MNDTDAPVVPIWTLSTSEATTLVPAVADQGTLTPERLTELRSALATFSSAPLVTLEAHPLAKKRERSAGLPLDALSPLAQELSRLVAANAKSVPAVAQIAESGEMLYKMVVPAKVAAQVGKGLVKPMKSKAVAGGIHGLLVDAKGIVANTSFVPVQSAKAGVATGTAVGTVAAGSVITVAAPLVLLAVAVGASAYADNQRQKAIERTPNYSNNSTTTIWSANATNLTVAATR